MAGVEIKNVLREGQFPGNLAAFEAVTDYLAQGNITAFTGAGVSTPLFPTWNGLLLQWLRDAEAQGAVKDDIEDYHTLLHKDPLELAELLEQAFGYEIFRTRLANIFRNPSGSITECHKLISELSVRGIVTLNYDNGHESACAAKGKNPNTGKAQDAATLTRWAQDDVFKDAQSPILHLHGDVSDPSGMILTSSDYDRFYSQSLPDSFVGQLWRTHRLFVIGFGFTDPFLTRIAERTLRLLPSDTRHFALIGRESGALISPIQRRIFAKKYRVTPIFYEVRDVETQDGIRQDHSDLLTILLTLQNSKAQKQDAPPAAISKVTESEPIEITKKSLSENDFRSDLFVAPGGNTLYVEPRFRPDTFGEGVASDQSEMGLQQIVSDTASYIVNCFQEYGATTVARRLLSDFSVAGKRCVLKDASILPNYKKKLAEIFSSLGCSAEQQNDNVLILDSFELSAHDRLLKELVGTKIFGRIIILARQNLFESSVSLPVDQYSVPFKSLTLQHLRRADIRTLAIQFCETDDADTTSAIVNKVYGDLVTLCIPMTPSNVVMYLSILFKDGDFQPVNRVQIVSKYLWNLLQSPGDIFRDIFNAKNKLDVISAFVFGLHEANKQTFSEVDWFVFCRDYMKATLTEFDERSLLNLLKARRVLVPIGPHLYFKYRFFHTFLLGRHIAARPVLTKSFIADNQYLKHSGLVEVMADLASDNEPLVTDIADKLESALSEFGQKFVVETFDPFNELGWPSHKDEEATLWKPLMQRLSSGPRNASEIDEIKSSFFEEVRASNQNIVVQDFNRLERRLIALHTAMQAAMINCDSLPALLKQRSIVLTLKGYLRILQVGIVLAPIISKQLTFRWHGLNFINMLEDEETDERKRTFKVLLALVPAVIQKTAGEIASRKLGEVFKLLAKSPDVLGFMGLLNFACLVRSKPRNWLSCASEIVASTDRNSFYLRAMVEFASDQFHDEINTTSEREDLKRLIAVIRMRRDLGKLNPGDKAIQQMIERMDKQKLFEPTNIDKS